MLATIHRFLPFVPVLVLLGWAAVEDWRTGRIRNWLTLTLALSGLVQSLQLFGAARTVPPGTAVLGLLTGFGLTFLLFAIGALGGGDVKLLAGLGAWIGPGPVLAVFLAERVIGMLIVLAQAAAAGRIRVLFRNSAVIAVNLVHLRDLGTDHVTQVGRACRSVDRPLPFAVPTLAATLLVLYVAVG